MKNHPKILFIFLILSFFQLGSIETKSSDGKLIDLTYSFDEQTIYWPTAEEFKLKKTIDGNQRGYYYSSYQFTAPEHGGTHIDAPKHFSQNGRSVDEIPFKQLIGNAVLIDVQKESEKDRDHQINVEDFLKWEKANGQIPKGSIVLLRTGFGKFWPDRKKYLGTDEHGPQAIAKLHFPGLHPQAAEWLIKNRSIKAVGLDTPSIDYGQSTQFETHRILGENNIPNFENLANLDQLPLKNFKIIALPMKIKEGSGAPLRIIAILNPL